MADTSRFHITHVTRESDVTCLKDQILKAFIVTSQNAEIQMSLSVFNVKMGS